ncbi:NEL-type E3 ubiquitin ligase domain-containing protein [Pseudomonas palleroniana]
MSDSPSVVSQSIHADLLRQSIPDWLTQATAQRRIELHDAPAQLPSWYLAATVPQRNTLTDAVIASFIAQTTLDKAMVGVLDVDTFAASLLVNALHDSFKLRLDVHNTFLLLRKPLEMGVLGIDIGSFEVLKLPLLQAALHNFEEAECEVGAFHESSGFLRQTMSGDFEAFDAALNVPQFIRLCRTLDVGKQYQAYLKSVLYPDDSEPLREAFIQAKKTALRAAAELALLKEDIDPAGHRMILDVIDGQLNPTLAGKPVWIRDLSLMNHRLTGCVMFIAVEKYRYGDDGVILYIPNDPHTPLKHYTVPELDRVFKQRFTERDPALPDDGSPTPYQRFFSQFVAYANRPDYFNQLTRTASGNIAEKLDAYLPLLNDAVKGINPFIAWKNLPPPPVSPKIANNDPYLKPRSIPNVGGGLWSENVDLWRYLFDRHRDQTLADARSHAVPTADVDARVRSQKFSSLLNIGMLALTTVSMFVPVLGEVMLLIMGGQLLYDTFTGVVEWSDGDRKAAKAHLLAVAENLALLAVTAGAGKGLAKLAAVPAEPVIEALEPVTLPDGQVRLWRPDLKGYGREITLNGRADAQGQYELDGKSYVRLGDTVVEKAFDESMQRWRIQHPSDPHAYQPPLAHNGAGAWRHTLERPLAWDRLTLLRRMGPMTDAYTDAQLLRVADISGVCDNALHKMHLDNAAPPPELADTLRLFETERGVQQLLAQLDGHRPIDELYQYAPPLITELPRWPVGRVLEVFEGPGLSGRVKYGRERLPLGVKPKAPIQISRSDVLGGQLPLHILASLDEEEIIQLLGVEPARVKAQRSQIFSRQLADFARTRQTALFDSLYKGQAPQDPRIQKLQRLTPALNEYAARSVLNYATAEELTRLDAGRPPLHLLEQSRWYARQGRMSRAFAGLHLENIASLDSKRLALCTLGNLPGWPQTLRLEIRDGGVAGRLLDALGSEQAPQRRYLVKRGPFYQAFNEQGEALSDVPLDSDNFYAALMHALPDEARQALGIAQVNRHEDLRRAIIQYALTHPADAQQVLGERLQQVKPPQRIGKERLGYLASGRGEAIEPRLASRVRDVYPNLDDQQANGFLLEQMRTGKSDQQIFSMLNNRLREWQQLEAALDQWVDVPGQDGRGKLAVAHALKQSWQGAPLAANPRYAALELWVNTSLPPLEADFSHVRDLNLSGYGLTNAGIDGLLAHFPRVSKLKLTVPAVPLRTLSTALERLPELNDLAIHGSVQFEPVEVAKLTNLVKLRALTLDNVLASLDHLELSRMTSLRELTLSGVNHGAFPETILDLPELRRVNLRGSRISQLPERLLQPGHEPLWSGLSLDWSRMPRQHFKPAYEYVKGQPEHLVALENMVRDYIKGEIKRIAVPDATSYSHQVVRANALFDRFIVRWVDAQARLDAMEVLSEEAEALRRDLDSWVAAEPSSPTGQVRQSAAATLQACWFEGVMRRYDDPVISKVVDLSGLVSEALPDLSAHDFGHIETLRLKELRSPLEQIRRFVRGFPRISCLDLTGSFVNDTPVMPGDLPALRYLDLSYTPLDHLDVSALLDLNMLKLQGARLKTWPVGAERLTQLDWLDLRHTEITEVPRAALEDDHLVLSLNLTGAPLTPQARILLEAAQRRVEFARWLPAGTLARFAEDTVPWDFPLDESAVSIASHLLPIPEGSARYPTLEALTQRLNGWLFIRTARGAGWTISAGSRRLAALRIIEAWRVGLNPTGADIGLSLNGLQVGDLPPLGDSLAHVTHLDLTGVRLTEEGSNGFLRSFVNLRSLYLSGQPLSRLPSAVENLHQLQELHVASTGIARLQTLYSTLERLPNLRSLDLGGNNLTTFNLERFPLLEVLDLRNNLLESWPEGTLTSAHLRALNLSGNEIESFPAALLDGSHDRLLEQISLSDGHELSLDSLLRLRAYADQHGRQDVMGISAAELDELIEAFGSDNGQNSTAAAPTPAQALSDEELSADEHGPEDRAPWLETLPADEASRREAQWLQLAGEPDNRAFFHLLETLQDSADFNVARADLTRRVWTVIDAATGNTELRQLLFGLSSTHGTCEDGRILTFSGLEVKVFEYQALLNIEPAHLNARGAALLQLSRRLFRLAEVEKLADAVSGHLTDKAEVRLEYRLGLKDVLDLPGQPSGMLYGRAIRGHTLEQAIEVIQQAEQGELFYEDLISRSYWVDYLKARYLESFDTLEREAEQRRMRLEDEHQAFDEAYGAAVTALQIELETARNQLLLSLSRQEVAALEATP